MTMIEDVRSADLDRVTVADLPFVWRLVEPMFIAAYAEMDMFLPDVLGWLKRGEGLLWIATDPDGEIITALTTSIEERPSGRTCLLVANGGRDIETWKQHLVAIETHYREEWGCVKVRCIGRPGWSRVLPGFSMKAVSLEKAL